MSVRLVAWLSFCCQYPISPDRAAGAHSGLALDSVATTPPTVPATAMTRPAPMRRVFREIFILIPLPGVRLSPSHVQPRLVPCARARRHLASPAPCARTRLYAPGRRPARAYRPRNRRVRTHLMPEVSRFRAVALPAKPSLHGNSSVLGPICPIWPTGSTVRTTPCLGLARDRLVVACYRGRDPTGLGGDVPQHASERDGVSEEEQARSRRRPAVDLRHAACIGHSP